MLTSDLLDRIQGNHMFGETKTNVSPDDVYRAAIFCQKEICEDLPVLEGVCGLEFVANQERYQYQTATISGTTGIGVSPIVLTTAANHGFQTNDSVSIDNVLGNTAANGHWQITVLSPTTFSINTTGNGAWTTVNATLTPTAIHLLTAAVTVKLIRFPVSPYGWLRKISQRRAERDRIPYMNGANPNMVTRYYEIQTNPITIGIQGVPTTNVQAEVTYQRRPLSTEDISATVNPLLPSQYDKLLYMGTLYHAVDNLDEDWAIKRSEQLKQKFEREKIMIRKTLVKRRLPDQEDISDLEM